MKSGSSTINWSDCKENIKSDITFKNEGDYYKHRVSKGYPQNWSDIITLDGIIVNEITNNTKNSDKLQYNNTKSNNSKSNDIKSNDIKSNDIKSNNIKYNKNGCYWKYNNKDFVYWSNNSKNIMENVKFDNESDYMSHRVNNGYPANWSNKCL